jgi:hypothetical protein
VLVLESILLSLVPKIVLQHNPHEKRTSDVRVNAYMVTNAARYSIWSASLIFDGLDFDIDALTDLAPITGAGG